MVERKGLRDLWQRTPADLRRYLVQLLEIIILLIFMGLFAVVFVRVLTYVLPFIIGFLLSVSLTPVARFLERQGLPRRGSILLTLVIVVGGILTGILYLLFQAAEEAANLSLAVPKYFTIGKSWFEMLMTQGMSVYGHLPPKLVAAMQTTTTGLVEQGRQLLLGVLSGLFSDVAVLPDWTVIVVIAVVAAYFYMVDRERLASRWRRLLPPGWAPKLESVAQDVGAALAGLFKAQLILIVVTSVICVAGLFMMQIRYALILGLAIGLTGWVPILGSGIVTLPWALGALATANYGLALKIVLLQAVASMVRHMIEPKILASNMGLGTFSTMFGMYVGLTSMGFLGLLVGPIVMIAIRSLLRVRMFVDFFPDSGSSGVGALPSPGVNSGGHDRERGIRGQSEVSKTGAVDTGFHAVTIRMTSTPESQERAKEDGSSS